MAICVRGRFIASAGLSILFSTGWGHAQSGASVKPSGPYELKEVHHGNDPLGSRNRDAAGAG